MKSKILPVKNTDTRKHPKSGYDERAPNHQFPVNSGKKIKTTANYRPKKSK